MYALFSLDLPFLQRERLTALAGGALGFLLCITLLRFEIPAFVQVKGLSWILILLTMAYVSFAQRALSRARDFADSSSPLQG